MAIRWNWNLSILNFSLQKHSYINPMLLCVMDTSSLCPLFAREQRNINFFTREKGWLRFRAYGSYVLNVWYPLCPCVCDHKRKLCAFIHSAQSMSKFSRCWYISAYKSSWASSPSYVKFDSFARTNQVERRGNTIISGAHHYMRTTTFCTSMFWCNPGWKLMSPCPVVCRHSM